VNTPQYLTNESSTEHFEPVKFSPYPAPITFQRSKSLVIENATNINVSLKLTEQINEAS
jgi:hypothetical protein